jgi:O-antigen/teichoic acid export membrane protein
VTQSFWLVVLQAFGIGLGLVSIFLVAANIPAELFALIGVYQVISSIVIVFSNTGLETRAMRSVLLLEKQNKFEEIRLLVSRSILFRLGLALIIFFPMVGYSIYISTIKFDGAYLGVLILMSAFSIIRALNDSFILILRSFNKYLIAAFLRYSINVFSRLIAIIIFLNWGFSPYLYTIIIFPVFIAVAAYIFLKRWFTIYGLYNTREIWDELKKSRSFTMSAYISYMFNHLDHLLVSLLLSPEIMGSFSIGKRLLMILKTLIENIFDPQIQGLVRFKDDTNAMKAGLNKILSTRNILVLISVPLSGLLIYYLNDFLTLFNLSGYVYLKYFIVSLIFSQYMHVLVKINYNYISLFYSPSFYLKLTSLHAIASIGSFAMIILVDIRFLFLSGGCAYIVMSFITHQMMKITEETIN